MPPFTVGTTTFPRKADAKVKVQEILHTSDLDVVLRGDNAVLVASLFAMHPSAAEKAARGVIGFMVRVNNYEGAETKGFHVVHTDRTTTAFSYAPCLNPAKPEIGASGAMRRAIMLGQRRVKVEYYAGREVAPCHLCRQPVPFAVSHVHHMPPHQFRVLAAGYAARFGEPAVTAHILGVDFASVSERARWLEYHDSRAHRVLVCAPCNYAAERLPAAAERIAAE